jgi:F0F1-type ATP synthase membrane subunit b/b'
MAAIEKRQKEISDGLASAERAKKDLDMQNHTKITNAMAWPRIVAFMFTAQYLFN